MAERTLGVLLAGGAATRLRGEAKGLLALAPDRRVCDAALDALGATCDAVLVAANDPQAATWGLGHPQRRDATPGLGALGALRTALAAADAQGAARVLVMPWDAPFVTRALGAALLARLRDDPRCDVAVPVHDGRMEPLVSAWRPRALAACDAALAAGERAAHRFVASRPWVALEGEALAACGDPARLFVNVNTDDDLAWARQQVRP